MSSTPGKFLKDIFVMSAQIESYDVEGKEFVARVGKTETRICVIASIFLTLLGIVLLIAGEPDFGIMFLCFGIPLLLIVPTLISYKCLVNKELMREEYYVLFVKIQKEIPWSVVEYRKISVGKTTSLNLYDKNKKRLISFDDGIVGFDRIMKLAKKSRIKDI